jgi:hypothetical protein
MEHAMFTAATASLVLLVAYLVLASVDGLYLHLWRFQLHLRPETQLEHLTHTARAVLFVPALVLVLAGDTSGPLLWAGVAVVLLDFLVGVADMLEEGVSRTFQGGLPRYELALHVVLSVLHYGAVAASLVARPAAAWTGTIPVDASAAWLSHVVWMGLLPGAVFAAGLHLWLAVAPRYGHSNPNLLLADGD